MQIDGKPFFKSEFDPGKYVMDPGLEQAVRVAIALDQPLLLTGEPGTGKTLLASKLAHELAKNNQELRFEAEPLKFYTKTTASAKDLFYTYDALAHFQAANIKRENNDSEARTADFIELQALGKAIARTNPAEIDTGLFKTDLEREPRSSVVLIDEIDKAPRDFPNDILNEIENLEFRIKEQNNYPIKAGKEQRIVLVMTSNSEKNLPDAFLRRCIFYHIPFPDDQQLLRIAKSQLQNQNGNALTDELLQELIRYFGKVRKAAVRKPPATAELVAWLRMLEMDEVMHKDAGQRQAQLRENLSVLVKTREDLEAVKELFLDF